MDIQKKIIDLEIIDAIEGSGVSELALVDAPAIEKLWMAFNKEVTEEKEIPQRVEKFSIVEDKKILVAPVCIPDIEIIRQDPKTKEIYYVRFSKDVIQRIAEKFMRENRNNETNLEHDTTTDAKTYVFESWIVEEETDKANSVYNLDVPIGTWCVKMRVTDSSIWADVKAGKLNGVSLEGEFISKEELDQYNKDRELYNNIVKILKGV